MHLGQNVRTSQTVDLTLLGRLSIARKERKMHLSIIAFSISIMLGFLLWKAGEIYQDQIRAFLRASISAAFLWAAV